MYRSNENAADDLSLRHEPEWAVLNYALSHGIINMSYVQDKYEMEKRKEYLNQHKAAITEGKDGYWRTYLPDGNSGRRQIKRRNRKDVEDIVIKFYKNQKEKPKTFDDVYFLWRRFQDEMVSGNTIAKYNTDYRRYFKNSDFARTNICNITEEDIQIFIVKTVKEQRLCQKACKTLFGYIANSIHSARVNRIITDNPMEFLQAKRFYKYCTEPENNNNTRVVSDEDMELLYKQFYKDYKQQPGYIPTYAVHMATLTGMRVGELAALKWSNITQDYIIIDCSEKYNRLTKEYFIDKTKNGKSRIFPITDEVRTVLEAVKKAEIKNGMLNEWVFSDKNGRIHASVISSCSKNKCRQVGISEKGIHAYRRTINSKMRCDGVSATVAAALLGHSPAVNEQYYTFDVSSIKDKEKIVSSINRHMPMAK